MSSPYEDLADVELLDYLIGVESVYGRLLIDIAQKCMRFDQEERCRSSYELVKKFERFDQSIADWCKYQREQLLTADNIGSGNNSRIGSRMSSISNNAIGAVTNVRLTAAAPNI